MRTIIKKSYNYLLISAAALTIFQGCDSTTHRSQPNTDHILIDVKFQSMFADMASIDTNNISQGLDEMKNKYGDFYDFYWNVIIQADSFQYPESEMMRHFFTNKDYRHLLDTVSQVYKDHSDIDNSIKNLFKNITYYDSTIMIPEHVVYLNSYLQSPAFTWDKHLGIGFDMYFGEDFWPYESESVRIPKFISRNNTRENIPVAVAKVLYTNMYPINEEDKSLLDLMILNGKSILYLNHVLPQHSMAKLLGFTDAQWAWCENNEQMIFNFFTSNQLLYEKNAIKIMRYIAPAPNSMGMPDEAPGRTAIYIGYKILKKYQEETGKSLIEILKENLEAQKVLKLSHYKPKK